VLAFDLNVNVRKLRSLKLNFEVYSRFNRGVSHLKSRAYLICYCCNRAARKLIRDLKAKGKGCQFV